MRRRLAFFSTLIALLLVLALPATTLGASYTYQVQKNTCSASGGTFGYGHMVFKVKLTEWGNTPANKFTYAAKVQHRNIGSRRWTTESTWTTFAYRFPQSSSSYWYTRWWDYDPHHFAWHRIVVQMKVWHNNSLLATRTIKGRYC